MSFTRNESDQPDKGLVLVAGVVTDLFSGKDGVGQGNDGELEIIEQCNNEEEDEITVTEPPTHMMLTTMSTSTTNYQIL